jgi:diguanylate cyclase (GGDEF)-like protein/PAS domain S-box-containing protein
MISKLDDRRLLDVNPALLTMLGCTREELIGRTFQEVGFLVSPKDYGKAVNTLRTLGKLGSLELQYRRKSGKTSTLLGSSELIHCSGEDCLLTMLFDISDRKHIEEMLRESESRFRNVFEASAIGMALVELDGSILKVNQSLCNSLGFGEEELLRATFQDVIYPEDLDGEKEHRQKLAGGEIPHYRLEQRWYRNDGHMLWVLLNVSMVESNGTFPPYLVYQIEDITERKLLEQKLQTMSIRDELTGLYNRRGFFTLCEQQLKLAPRTKNEHFTLFFADLDGLKWINDTLGHLEGDGAIVAVAKILKDTFRESDIVARMGGDEFAVFAVGAGESQFLKRRLKANIEEFNRTSQSNWTLSVTVGVTSCKSVESVTLETMIAQADASMYEEKRRKQRQHKTNPTLRSGK